MRHSMRPWAELVPLSAVPGVYSSYAWNNVGLTLWFGPATLESLETFEATCRKVAADRPVRWSSVHIMVPGNSGLPSAEARAALARMTREMADTTAAIAVVIPGTGFWASAIRGLVTAVHMLGSRDFELKIFGNVEEVAQWLPEAQLQRSGVEISPAQLLDALRQLQRTMESAAA